MDFLEALILGVIQGLTEFLPVSSSGHLEIAKFLLNDESISEKSLLFTVILHFATALSTITIFRKSILEIIKGLFSGDKNAFNFSLMIVVSMVPAAIIGVLFDDLIDSFFQNKILLVCFMLVITGFLLFIADRAKETNKDVSIRSAFIIGIAQMIAILPGISRSGSTISTAVLLGIDRYKAAHFSFLMVIPLIFGKMLKDVISGEMSVSSEQQVELLVGFVAAFITGIVACNWMIKLVKQSQLKWFSYYCFAVAIAVAVYVIS